MKHARQVSRPRPMMAGEADFYCQLAAILSLFGVQPTKEILQKCIGIDI